jgi:hypothetical protein
MNFPIIGCEIAKTAKLMNDMADTVPLDAENSNSQGCIKAPKEYLNPCAAKTPIKETARMIQP